MEAMAHYTSMVKDVMAGSIAEIDEDVEGADQGMAPAVSRMAVVEEYATSSFPLSGAFLHHKVSTVPSKMLCSVVADADKDLIYYAIEGNLEQLCTILRNGDVPVDFRDDEGRT